VLHPRHACQQLLLQRRIFEDAEGDHQQVPLPADGTKQAKDEDLPVLFDVRSDPPVFFDVRSDLPFFSTYHSFLTITSSSRIISRDGQHEASLRRSAHAS
jgi:hypothetical protein